MRRIAVVAHAGQDARRRSARLAAQSSRRPGSTDPLWCEVPKSRKAPPQVERALEEGAELVFVWGGDGMVQRCTDVLAGTGTPLAIIPAGTANLLATNLGIPKDIEAAVDIGLHGERPSDRRRADERRAVRGDGGRRVRRGDDPGRGRRVEGQVRADRLRLDGATEHRAKPFKAKIRVDGASWFDGKASCILLGNVGDLFGGVEAFDDA